MVVNERNASVRVGTELLLDETSPCSLGPMTSTRRAFAILATTVALPSLASAQVACTITGPVAVRGYAADACQKAADIFTFVMPQFAQALSGGGVIIGTANTLGGLGKFSLNARVSAVDGVIPDIDALNLNPAGAQRSTIATLKSPVPAPAVDVGVGIFQGFRVGSARIFSLDGVVSIAYLPDVDVEGIQVVVPGERLKVGYGGRFGLTRDTKGIPAISASYIKRELPTSDLTADFEGGSGGTDQLALTGFTVSTEAIRVSLSKKLGFLEIGGGVGRDTYDTRLNVRATVNEGGNTGTAALSFAQNLTRDVAYVSAAVNFPLFKVSAEVGQASGGEAITTFNTINNAANDTARYFASAGLRISF